MAARFSIARLGDRGDGIARSDGADIAIPGALPGETVIAEGDGNRRALVDIVSPSAARVLPICPLFGSCGGCAVQHLANGAIADWKRARIEHALSLAGIDAPIAATVDAHGAGRRRAVFHLRRVDGRFRAGFMAARTHQLVPTPHCPILAPGLAQAASAAEALADVLFPRGRPAKPLDIQATATETGLDLDIRGHGPIDADRRAALAVTADTFDLARLSLHGASIAERRKPVLSMGRARVTLPPGGFLQATAAGEAAMAERVLAALDGARKVADMFCGCGPFALRLAEHADVLAFDSDTAAVAALLQAHRATPGLKPLAATARDLFRRPPLPTELAGRAVVFDPPRAGAEATARALAAAEVRLVAAVSCNPVTFARDARVLLDGGFALAEVTPIDQFRYSAHIELVAVFKR
jgi:23S rRNA (uracil1939-C5)-methyltransferase